VSGAGAGSGRRPFVIGVTGNIACGKSTVLRLLAERGAETIDADAVYHGLIRPGAALWRALRDRFGEGVVAPDGTIDRRALGAVVFSDRAALAELDALTHPAVVAEIRSTIARSDAEVLAIDAVKLIESGLGAVCDQIWIVTCRPEQQVARLMARNGLAREEAVRRVSAQPEIAAKLARADVVIDNGGSIEETRFQVEAAWAELPSARTGTVPNMADTTS
jgi:dephospho-CoA kinase